MANVRQRIVLTAESNKSAAAPIIGREGGLQPIGMRCDREPLCLEKGYDVSMGFEFGVSKFWIIVDLLNAPSASKVFLTMYRTYFAVNVS